MAPMPIGVLAFLLSGTGWRWPHSNSAAREWSDVGQLARLVAGRGVMITSAVSALDEGVDGAT
jgi:hypothetical protein